MTHSVGTRLRQMWRRQSLRQKGIAALALPFGALFIAALLTFVLDVQRRNVTEALDHAFEANDLIETNRRELADASLALWQYLLTGQRAGLDPYWHLQHNAGAMLAELRRHVEELHGSEREGALLQDHYRQVEVEFTRALTSLAELRVATATQSEAEAATLSQTAESRVGALRQALSSLQSLEESNLLRHQAQLERFERWATLLFGVNLALGLIGGGFALSVLGNSVTGRTERLLAQTEQFAEGPQPLPARDGGDELDRLRHTLTLQNNRFWQQSDRLDTALSVGEIAVWEYDPATRVTHYHSNPDFLGAFGLSPQDPSHTTETRRALVDPQDRPGLDQALAHALRTGTLPPTEYRVHTPNGQLRWFVTQGRYYAEDNAYMLGVVVDITERKESEQALKESEARLQDFLDNASDLIQSVAPDGRLLYVNRTWRETLGYREDELGDLSMMDIIHPDNMQSCMLKFQQVVSGTPLSDLEATFVAKDGRRVEVRGNANCRFEHGQPVSTRSIFRNVTDAKRAEAALRRSEARFRRLSSATTEGIAIVDAGVIVDANASLAALSGRTLADLLGERLDAVLRYGKVLEPNTAYDADLKTSVGLNIPVEIVVRDVAPQSPQQIIAVRDLRQRRATEAKLSRYQHELEERNQELEGQREQLTKLAEFRRVLVEFTEETLRRGIDAPFYQRLLERAVAVIPGAQAGSLLMKQADDNYRYIAAVNQDLKALQQDSFSADDMAIAYSDTRPTLFYDAAAADKVQGAPQDGAPKESVFKESEEAGGIAGRHASVCVAMSVPVSFEGQTVAYLNLDNFDNPDAFDDDAIGMTEAFAAQVGVLLRRLRLEDELRRRQAEIEQVNTQLERASRLKSEFLANMSHELRTPLTAIIGFSELMQEELFGPLNDKQQEYIDDIHASGKHLLSLINDILDLSKIEAGRMELHPELIDVEALAQSAATIIKERIQAANLVLDVTVSPQHDYLYADARKIKQVLYNLLSNAVKFTPAKGKVSLSITDDGERVHFRVRDTGVGIAEADQVLLFQEFSQVDSSLSRRHEGTGLGLALSKRLIELHGGEIWVESTLGEGSTFGFSVPHRPNEPEPSDVSTVEMQVLDRTKVQVLVVEDDERSGALLQTYLEQEGYQVWRARNGQEGLDTARRIRPDIITLDVMMPVMSGWALLETITTDPELADIPVVIVSVTGEATQGYALGASAVLAKPVDRKTLSQTLLKALERASRDKVVLVVSERVNRRLVQQLEHFEYYVIEARSYDHARELCTSVRPDLLILDLSNEGGDSSFVPLQDIGVPTLVLSPTPLPPGALVSDPASGSASDSVSDPASDSASGSASDVVVIPRAELADAERLQQEIQRVTHAWRRS